MTGNEPSLDATGKWGAQTNEIVGPRGQAAPSGAGRGKLISSQRLLGKRQKGAFVEAGAPPAQKLNRLPEGIFDDAVHHHVDLALGCLERFDAPGRKPQERVRRTE